VIDAWLQALYAGQLADFYGCCAAITAYAAELAAFLRALEAGDYEAYPAGVEAGLVALSLCTNHRPLHTRFTMIISAPFSEATMRPNPRWRGC
jgi:hypothetical protein